MLGDRAPSWAAILTVLGGAFVLAGGLLLWIVGTPLARVFGLSGPVFLGGVIVGGLTVVVGALMGILARGRRTLAAVALACAGASLPLAFGGLVVGFVLTAVGGAFAWARPRRTVTGLSSPAAAGTSPPWT